MKHDAAPFSDTDPEYIWIQTKTYCCGVLEQLWQKFAPDKTRRSDFFTALEPFTDLALNRLLGVISSKEAHHSVGLIVKKMMEPAVGCGTNIAWIAQNYFDIAVTMSRNEGNLFEITTISMMIYKVEVDDGVARLRATEHITADMPPYFVVNHYEHLNCYAVSFYGGREVFIFKSALLKKDYDEFIQSILADFSV